MKKYITVGMTIGAMMLTNAVAFAETSAEANVNVEVRTPAIGIPPMPGERALEVRKEIMQKRGDMMDTRDQKIEDRMEKRDEMMDKRNQNVEDRMEKRDEHRTDMMRKFDEKTKEMRLKFQEMFAKKSLRGVAQVENLVVRFETHLAKIKASGTNTATADAQLIVVKTNLTTAKAKIAALVALYPTDGTEMTEAQKTAVITAKTEAEVAIKATHKSLWDLLVILKGYRVNASASTTTTTTTQ